MKSKFGENFLDSVLHAEGFRDNWNDITICRINDPCIKITSNAIGLNYAVSVFEGIRATPVNGQFSVFRLKDHLDRLNKSCERLCIPLLDITQLISNIQNVLKAIPVNVTSSLELNNQYIYIRPIVFNKENILYIASEEQFQINVYFCTTNNYEYNGELISVNDTYPRALPSLGNVKTSGNYGHMLHSMKKAKALGFNQELWLDFRKTHVQELSTMNFFLKTASMVFTPALTDQILPGITRDTIINIAKEMGVEVIEDKLDLRFLLDSISDDNDAEIFGTGTASGLISFSGLSYNNKIIPTKCSCFADELKNQLLAKYRAKTPE